MILGSFGQSAYEKKGTMTEGFREAIRWLCALANTHPADHASMFDRILPFE